MNTQNCISCYQEKYLNEFKRFKISDKGYSKTCIECLKNINKVVTDRVCVRRNIMPPSRDSIFKKDIELIRNKIDFERKENFMEMHLNFLLTDDLEFD